MTTTGKHRDALASILEVFCATWRPPGVSILKLSAVWNMVLGDFTDEELRRGAYSLMRTPREFFPSPGHLIEAIRGRVVKVPEYVTDAHNARVLRNGAPWVERWHTVRVPLDWTGDPGNLDYGTDMPDLDAIWAERPQLGGPSTEQGDRP